MKAIIASKLLAGTVCAAVVGIALGYASGNKQDPPRETDSIVPQTNPGTSASFGASSGGGTSAGDGASSGGGTSAGFGASSGTGTSAGFGASPYGGGSTGTSNIGSTASPSRSAASASTLASNSGDDSIRRLVAELKTTTVGESLEERGAKRQKLFDATKAQLIQMEGVRSSQVAMLERRLTGLKQVLELRAKNLDTITENRVKSLLGETSELDWAWGIPDLSTGIQNVAPASQTTVASATSPPKSKGKIDDLVALGYGMALLELNDKRQSLQRKLDEKEALTTKLNLLQLQAKSLGENNCNDNTNLVEFNQAIEGLELLSENVATLYNQIESEKGAILSLETRLEPLSREIERTYHNSARY